MAYDSLTSRDVSNDPVVPEQYSAALIAETTAASAALTLCKTVPMSSKTSRTPVLSLLPEAYWVASDVALKQTTKIDFANSYLTAEEIAVIVPIPDAYVDDSAVPLWDVVRPLVAEAFGKVIDNAIFWGTGKPSTWTDAAIIPGAIAAGNTVAMGTGDDIGVDVASMGQLVAEDGYALNSFACEPGFDWRLVGSRAKDGSLIYGGPIAAGQPGTLYGRPLYDVKNGSWDGSTAHLVGGDFSKAIVGIRQDLTYKLFSEGVITDAAGAVVLNLMQSDAKALRVVMRLGYALPKPASRIAGSTRFPFAVLEPEVTTP